MVEVDDAPAQVTRYRTIVADPPWDYGRARPGFSGLKKNPGAMLPYESMSLDAIADLPVNTMADDSAHLYLWTTNRFLRDSFAIVDAWGFKFSCVLAWCKEPLPFSYGSPAFKSTLEFALFARKGKIAPLSREERQWFQWPRAANSQKPEAFLDMVERVSPEPRVELFARRARFGWDYWGDQSLGTADLAA
jgi:N6-adenosine-specific RNA methylase IME4